MKNIALRSARLEKGLTQDELAKMLGYKGRQSISNWENGYVEPPLKVAIKVSKILGKDLEYLFSCYKVQETHTNNVTQDESLDSGPVQLSNVHSIP
ncbi:helix-turn-helix transcriptional regulator [Polycladomyces sp. WAk]|uniref:Helix-turn-helix transcriptional regulator n=1 Tax=Polycladomyces zharkentensis TaxID=2807616 RepID=A0ABS2WHV6_9BACL|nr:helix-turn-helix transcriptional regulator [Polycladomyces sp. WAk]MBN2909127.1 helix-turn-helix transcriptional regulator [Polycladomyces sp. WAk]